MTDVVTTITAITSTVGSGATVSTFSLKSYGSMEISGEDDSVPYCVQKREKSACESRHVDRRNWMMELSQRLCLTVFSIR